MLSPTETARYERNSNEAAGLCRSCAKSLQSSETYCCHECAHEAYVETDPHGVMHDEEAEKAVQES